MAFDWEHNLGHHKTYIGDQTLYAYFEDGFTVTFNPILFIQQKKFNLHLIQMVDG